MTNNHDKTDASDQDWYDVLAGSRSADLNNLSERRAHQLRKVYLKRQLSGKDGGFFPVESVLQKGAAPTTVRLSAYVRYAAAAVVGAVAIGIGVQSGLVPIRSGINELAPAERWSANLLGRTIPQLEITIAADDPVAGAEGLFTRLQQEGAEGWILNDADGAAVLCIYTQSIDPGALHILEEFNVPSEYGAATIIAFRFQRADRSSS